MTRRNVLFLCTANSARSILAEALLRHRGGERYRTFSAGSVPEGRVHPLALDLLRTLRLPTAGLRSKGWDEFARPDAPRMDFVITVCDRAAGEACPVWPGAPVISHWSVADPAAVAGPEAFRRAAFRRAHRAFERRIATFTRLPVDALDARALARSLAEIGDMIADEAQP